MRQCVVGDGLKTSCIGLGALVLSPGAYGQAPSDAAGARLLVRAHELGVTHFDTADVYGVGHNETLLGRALRGHRKSVVIATKFGLCRQSTGAFTVDGRPDYVRHAAHASLRRLGTDYIDLYYLHWPDPAVPIEETVGAMADLVRAGQVRQVGLSNTNADLLRRAAKVHRIAVVQAEYSLWTRGPETELLPAARALGTGFVAWGPLSHGLLSGAVTSEADLSPQDIRAQLPRFQGDNLDENARQMQELRALAVELGVTLSELALAWLLHQSDVIPIPGTRSVAHLETNVRAADVTLTQAMVKQIGLRASLASVRGAPPAHPPTAPSDDSAPHELSEANQ